MRRLRREFAAEQCIDPCAATLRKQSEADAAVVLECKGNVGLRQRDAAERFLAVAVLGGICAQELASRRGVEEQFVHRHRRSARQRCGLWHADFAGVDLDAPRVRLVARARGERYACDRSDAGQRFAAKSQRRDAFEITRRRELRRCVTGNRELQVLALDAPAVVGDANQLDAAAGERDVDFRRTGIVLFSRSSFNAAAGRSITSPAAIWLMS